MKKPQIRLLCQQQTCLFGLVLLTLLVIAMIVVRLNKPPAYKKGSSTTYDMAVGATVTLYKKRAAEGMDFDNGPCLSNDLMPDWVADIVHSPREPIDDLPINQCAAYVEGRAHHFVELDTSGNVVRVR